MMMDHARVAILRIGHVHVSRVIMTYMRGWFRWLGACTQTGSVHTLGVMVCIGDCFCQSMKLACTWKVTLERQMKGSQLTWEEARIEVRRSIRYAKDGDRCVTKCGLTQSRAESDGKIAPSPVFQSRPHFDRQCSLAVERWASTTTTNGSVCLI